MVRRSVTLAVGGLLVWAAGAQAAGSLEATVRVEREVNLASPGLVSVELLSDGAVDAAQVDTATVALDGARVALANRADLDADGRDDLALHFRADEVGVTPTTRALALSGRLADGRAISGSAAVDVSVTLEVKLRDERRVKAELEGERLEPLVNGEAARRLAARARRPAPDMESWHRLTLPADTDVEAVLAELRALSDVLHAEPAPEPAPPPQASETPSFASMQGYLRPAPTGIDSDFSLADPRARGAGIRIADLEYYWTASHEDLQLDPVATDLGAPTFPQYTNFNDEHGTAVFGEMVGRDNGYGVTGGVPDASMHGISPTRRTQSGGTQYVPAAALTHVGQFLSAGDVVLIEQQTVGPNGGTRYVPLEWTQSSFDAVKALHAAGIVVVETGGNGSEDLDSPAMQGRFDRTVRDSGAIIVGAGSSTDRTALNFSSHGTRVDLQGWGQNITTTGGNGNLHGGTSAGNRNIRYTRTFGGTSGAGPIVTNAVVAVQSYLKATGQGVWTSQQLIDLLRRTGTPQNGTRLVGPLPNVQAALREIEVDAPVTSVSISPEDVNGWHLNPTVTLSADDAWGVGVASSEYRLDGGPWRAYEGPFQVTEPGEHTLEFRSTDAKGNVETTRSHAFAVFDLETSVEGSAGASVPATLSLTLGAPAGFGAFTPGIGHDYDATMTANVIATSAEATLSVTDPSATARGRLVNGAFALAAPLHASASSPAGAGGAAAAVTGSPVALLGYDAPVSNDPVTIAFRQHVGANEPLRTGSYSKPLIFTLSTTMP